MKKSKRILSEQYIIYYQFKDTDGFFKRGEHLILSDKKDEHGRLALEYVKKNPGHTILKVVCQ